MDQIDIVNRALGPADHKPETPNKWHWRNLRSVGLGFEFWLWPWAIGYGQDADVYGGVSYLHVGPFAFSIKYSIGNASANFPSSLFALSETEAWERIERRR